MSIRAKFKVWSVSRNEEYNLETVTFGAVYGKDGSANAAWSKATPNANLQMTISNPEAHGKLQVGKEYFIDITEAPADT